MRRAIAKAMSASALVPQFSVEVTVDARALINWRDSLSANCRPSYTDVTIASSARALSDHPAVNASFLDDAIIQHDEINVAFAVSLHDGLVSPVIQGADRLALDDVTATRRRLTEAARCGSLVPEQLLSATFTISNLGPLGIYRFNALVVPPQAAILAVGSIERDTMVLTLSADHRVLDGVPAAAFLKQVGVQLEDAEWLDSLRSRARTT
jgi:pyruvate dehydrogenase E2 component (dihydrolipoamide acetyltransferase)